MPADMSKYPKDWPQIRARILDRAKGNCEWCGVPNGAIGHRIRGEFEACSTCRDSDFGCGTKATRIVLTIAHITDPDPMNVADDNLAALCQRCHLAHDMDHHKRNAAETRRRKRIDAGQREMFDA